MKKGFGVVLGLVLASSSPWAQTQNVFITNSAAGTVSVVDAGTLTLLPNLPNGPNPITVGTTPTACISDLSRNLVYVLNSGVTPATVSVIDTQRFRVVNTVTVPSSGSVGGMTMSQNSRFLYIAGLNTVSGEAGVFQIDLNVVTLATTQGTYVAGIASTAQAADCEVIPASVVGGSGNGPGRIYFSVTSTNVIGVIDMLVAIPSVVTLTMPSGVGTPRGPTLMTRSPDSTFILTGTSASGVFNIFQLFRINPTATTQVDFLSITGGNQTPTVEDVTFRSLDVAAPFNVYFLGNDIPGRSVHQFQVGATGAAGVPTAAAVLTGYGLELAYDPYFERLFISGLGFTAPASYDHFSVKSPPPSGETSSNSGGNNPRQFAFAPAPPPPALDYLGQPAGMTSSNFQLELLGSGFLQGSSRAQVQDSVGVATFASTTTVLNSGDILATFPPLPATHYNVSVLNNDGNVSTLTTFFQGLKSVPSLPPPTYPAVTLPRVGSGYLMVSFPQYSTVADLRNAATAQLGPYNSALYRIFLWEQDHYLELNNPLLSPSMSLMGTGFFVITRSGGALSLPTAPDVNLNDTIPQRAVALTPGWNIVSQPLINGLTNTLQYANLQVTANKNLTGTVPANISPLVSNVIYELLSGSYVTSPTMVAGKAYWMLNQSNAPVYLVVQQGAVTKLIAATAKTTSAASSPTPPAPPGASLNDSSSGGCGLLGGELLLVVLFLRGRGSPRRSA